MESSDLWLYSFLFVLSPLVTFVINKLIDKKYLNSGWYTSTQILYPDSLPTTRRGWCDEMWTQEP